MSRSLETVLGYVALTGTIQQTTTGIPDPLPEGFRAIKKNTIADQGRYTQVTGTRTISRVVQYGAPALKRALKNIAYKDVKLLHTFEEHVLNPLVLQQLRNYNNYDIQRLGMEELARQVAEFKQNFVNHEIAASQMVLQNGNIWYDANGNMLPSSSGAVETVSFNVPATNTGQLPVLSNGTVNVILFSWANALTDIPTQIRSLKQAARQLTGFPVKYAIYGKNVPSYLTNNDYVLDYLSRNPSMQNQFLSNDELPNGLFGLDWRPAYETFFEDQNGVNQAIWGDDTVTFTPEVTADWWEFMSGSYMVPQTINIVTDANAAMASMRQVWGMFGYGQVTHNPVTITTYFGDTFLPVLKNSSVVWLSSVKF